MEIPLWLLTIFVGVVVAGVIPGLVSLVRLWAQVQSLSDWRAERHDRDDTIMVSLQSLKVDHATFAANLAAIREAQDHIRDRFERIVQNLQPPMRP